MIKPLYYVVRCAALVAAMLSLAGESLRAQALTASTEPELIEILRTASPAEKALACKQLAIHGSQDAVPELAKLLGDEQLASWSRIALEAIPDAAADEALREALDELDGKLLVGVINSIGVRRDANAVEPLSSRLSAEDADVAASAAVALGHIGDAAATTALRQALVDAPQAIRSAVAEGCVLCAERLMTEGQLEEAAAIYDEVRGADVPKQRVLEATRGAILARKSDGIPLLLDQLQSSDKGLVQIALSAARELSGSDITATLAADAPRIAPERGALLLLALADRNEPTLPPAVLEAAKRGDRQVRMAAIGFLGRVADASGLSTLLDIAAETDADMADTAKMALTGLPGDNVDSEIVSRLSDAAGKPLAVLIDVIGKRRIDAKAALTKALENSDSVVRHAALNALGETVGPDDLRVLIAQVRQPATSDDAPIAQQALLAASVRMPDRDACSAELAAAMEGVPVATKVKLLEILGAVGGAKSLATIGAAVNSRDEELQDTGTRLLGEWMNVDAAPVLLDLANNPSANRFQVRALRGYIRLVRQFSMPDAQRAEMCRHALSAAQRGDERQLVLAVLERYPSMDTLQVAVEAARTPELRDSAARVATAIAEKLDGNPDEIRELLDQVGIQPVEAVESP